MCRKTFCTNMSNYLVRDDTSFLMAIYYFLFRIQNTKNLSYLRLFNCEIIVNINNQSYSIAIQIGKRTNPIGKFFVQSKQMPKIIFLFKILRPLDDTDYKLTLYLRLVFNNWLIIKREQAKLYCLKNGTYNNFYTHLL